MSLLFATVIPLLLLLAVVFVHADSLSPSTNTDSKKSAALKPSTAPSSSSSSTTTPTKYSNAWLPDWLPNIHKLNQKACRGISEYRKNSPIVKQVAEHKSDPKAEVTLQSVTDKIKLATKVSGADGDLRKALGYKIERVNGLHHARDVTEPRILCLGFSHIDQKATEEKLLSKQYKSWAKNCHNTLLYTRLKNIQDVPQQHVREIHPIQGDAPHNLWQKIRLALSMLIDPAQDAAILQDSDYVILFSDDSWFSLTNVKALLMEPYVQAANRLNSLMLLGHRMNEGSTVFVSNLGYIMNRQLVRVLADLVNTPACDPMAVTGSDDIQLGKCLTVYGIHALDSYDEIGEDRMSMWEPDMIQYSVRNGFPDWYIRFRGTRPVPKSLAIVGQHACAFHGVTTDEKADRLEKMLGGR